MASAISDEPPAADLLYSEYLQDEIPSPITNKKKKLTKAEKLELKQKEEIEFKKLEMRDLMKSEYELSKKTAQKYHKRWEKMCKEIKLKEMKKELKEWEKKVNRVLQQKDEKIKLIFEEITTTEEMHKNYFSTQIQIMDYLKGVLKTFQNTCHALYKQEACELLLDFYREIGNQEDHDKRIKTNCESVVHATELLAEQEILNDYKIFLDKRDDRVNSEIEKRYRGRDRIIRKMKDLHKQLIEFLESLRNISLDAHKYERVNALMERQRNFNTETQNLNNIESRNSRIFNELQHELLQEDAEGKRKINDLKLEHAYFLQMRKNIENEMKLDRDETYEKLKIISGESFIVLKKFQKLQKYGELLLSLASSCRKFQTESEKIVPWGDFQAPLVEDLLVNETFKFEIINLKDHIDISEDELQTNMELMKNFWRRQAFAEAQIVILEEKKANLLKENEKYIATIKRLSKADNVDDLKETLNVQGLLDKETNRY